MFMFTWHGFLCYKQHWWLTDIRNSCNTFTFTDRQHISLMFLSFTDIKLGEKTSSHNCCSHNSLSWCFSRFITKQTVQLQSHKQWHPLWHKGGNLHWEHVWPPSSTWWQKSAGLEKARPNLIPGYHHSFPKCLFSVGQCDFSASVQVTLSLITPNWICHVWNNCSACTNTNMFLHEQNKIGC